MATVNTPQPGVFLTPGRHVIRDWSTGKVTTLDVPRQTKTGTEYFHPLTHGKFEVDGKVLVL